MARLGKHIFRRMEVDATTASGSGQLCSLLAETAIEEQVPFLYNVAIVNEFVAASNTDGHDMGKTIIGN